jgi:hypothetical protein
VGDVELVAGDPAQGGVPDRVLLDAERAGRALGSVLAEFRDSSHGQTIVARSGS